MNILEKFNQLNISLQGNELLLLFESQLKSNNAHHFPLLKVLKKSKHTNYIKYAKGKRKLIAASES